jgi:2-amino-4-hydroxy-6-hydroxymethyldihydropteridine diphosphokinase
MLGYLSIGSNLGNRGYYLKEALSCLSNCGVVPLKISSVYETIPLGVKEIQDNFFNLVVSICFDMGPFALLETCLDIELKLGRTRPYHHAPRVIDIDILLVEKFIIDTCSLKLPHPGIQSREFVIWPMQEIAPRLILPSGRSISELKDSCKDGWMLGKRKL